jgi:putative LysE/RhtB family amino acid efflux pump
MAVTALFVGFGLGFFVAAQLGPTSLLAGGVSVARRWVGERLLRTVDGVVGAGLIRFGGLLAYRTLRD